MLETPVSIKQYITTAPQMEASKVIMKLDQNHVYCTSRFSHLSWHIGE